MVTLVLDKMELEFCLMVWRQAAGDIRKAVSPRIVHACICWLLVWVDHMMYLCQWSVWRSYCLYSKWYKCFCDDLQDLLSSILPNDLLLMLGDLNSNFWVWDRFSELWSDVLGCFVIDDRIKADQDLWWFESTVIGEHLVSVLSLWDVDSSCNKDMKYDWLCSS